ncbi:MAG: ubiquinol-cytochrome C reductase [Caulobacterales bacterium]|nr:ubiquinol-cytochrome C reductase [Caulobacterales bacterium]
MFLSRFFRKRPAEAAGAALFAAAAQQARTPALYARFGSPDTLEGRFELYTLHVVMLVERLSGQGDQAQETSQGLFDAYVRSLDDALRQIGVGDLSMGKKMKKLAGAFYGRLATWEEAVAPLPDRTALEAMLGRTVFEGAENAEPSALADYAVRTREALAAQPLANLLSGEVSWPQP